VLETCLTIKPPVLTCCNCRHLLDRRNYRYGTFHPKMKTWFREEKIILHANIFYGLEKAPRRLLMVLALLLTSFAVFAEEPISNGVWPRIQDTLSQTWQSTDYELYIPINTWHNRSAYSSEEIDDYNEHPWGLGVGKYRFDEDGDWNALYVMAFQDSNNHLQPVAGYGFQKIWRPADDLRLGAGYAVGLTARQGMYYLPIPGIFPLFSVEYKALAVQSTYIPGGNGYGNILFTWLRWQM